MRVIAVDDEGMSLMRLERILREIPGVTFVAGYQNPEEALLQQKQIQPEVALLDVEMPQMTGLALAERLVKVNPALEIIFITAHEQYALRAYRQNAIGYLLKPVQPEEVRAQLERVQRYRKQPSVPSTAPLRCLVFGSFHVRMESDSARLIEFRTEKTAELLAILINQRGKPLSRDAICNQLWPDMNAERATRNFHTTAYNLRHTFSALGYENILQRAHESYWLNGSQIQNDLDVFCRAIERDLAEPDWLAVAEAGVNVYSGVYMANMDYLWLMEQQTYYEYQFEKLCRRLTERHARENRLESALDSALRWTRQCPLSEEASECLVRLYEAAGNDEKAALERETFLGRYRREMAEEPEEAKAPRGGRDGTIEKS